MVQVLCPNTGDVLEMSVVRGVGGVCRHVYVFRLGAVWVERGVSG